MKPSQEEIVQEARIEARTKSHQSEDKNDEVLLFSQVQGKKARTRKRIPWETLQDISESKNCVNLPKKMSASTECVGKKPRQIIVARYVQAQKFRQLSKIAKSVVFAVPLCDLIEGGY